MTFYYNDSGLENNEESTLDLYRLNGGKWKEINGTSLNTSTNIIVANLSEFGRFGFFRDQIISESIDMSDATSGSIDDDSLPVRVKSQSRGITYLPLGSDGKVAKDTVAKSADSSTTVTMFRGTVAVDPTGNAVGKITVNKLSSPPTSAPSETHDSGIYVDFGPSGTSFSKEVMITLDFDPKEFSNEQDPVIYTYSGEGEWLALETTVNWEKGRATAYTTHFSVYALFGVYKEEEIVEEIPEAEGYSSVTVEEPVDEDSPGYLYWTIGMAFAIIIMAVVVMKGQKGRERL